MLHSTEQITCRVKVAAKGWPHWRQSGIVVLRNLFFILPILCLTACNTTVFDDRACPMAKKYSKAELNRMADELEKAGPALKAMSVDYMKLRDQVRACSGKR